MPASLLKKLNFLHFGIFITIVSGSLYAYNLFLSDKDLYLIGETTHGHYQIEIKCDACHTKPFSGEAELQNACVNCHGEELKIAKDTHPKTKFTDPRNAQLLTALDARSCVSCHQEHRPEITRSMGVTLANDFCFHCHQDIETDVPSHKDFTFDSCASAGCHNFHDNRGLYEEFLAKHVNEQDIVNNPTFKIRYKSAAHKRSIENPLPDWQKGNKTLVQKWQLSAHAQQDINCSDCHKDQSEQEVKDPIALNMLTCQECHERQTSGFLSGRHGMRLQKSLSPMSPALARIDMRTDSHEKILTCASCHDPHSTDIQFAAVEACLSCHNDQHSLAYKQSPHFKLWQDEISGDSASGTGLSCAGCHMPAKIIHDSNKKIVSVEHNQNDNLRPNEKMLRGVCLNCHGADFSLKALADPNLIQSNFTGKPTTSLRTMEMVKKRLRKNKIAKHK